MGEVIGAIVFGLIGIAVLGAVVYILGFMLSVPASFIYNTVKGIEDYEHEHHPRTQTRHGQVALHH